MTGIGIGAPQLRHPLTPSRRQALNRPGIGWLRILALGGLLGIAAAWLDVLAGRLDPSAVARAMSMILNAGVVWAGLAVLSGWLIRRPIAAAAVAGAAGLMAAVIGYYTYGALLGDRTNVGLPALTGALRTWAIMAVAIGPLLGFVGALIHRPGPVGILAALVVPVGVVAEMIGLRRLSTDAFAVDPVLAWAQAAMVAAAIVTTAAILVRHLGPAHRRDSSIEATQPGEREA